MTPINHLSSKAWILITLGLLSIARGVYYSAGSGAHDLPASVILLQDSLIPTWIYPVLWWVAGVLAVVTAFHKPWKPIGFAATAGMNAGWAIAFLASYLASVAQGDGDKGWMTAVQFLGLAVVSHLMPKLLDRKSIQVEMEKIAKERTS